MKHHSEKGILLIVMKIFEFWLFGVEMMRGGLFFFIAGKHEDSK